MIETYKDIIGYEGKYQISNLGNVLNSRQKLIKPIVSNTGYIRIGLRNQGKKLFSVHRLVAIAFIPNPNNKPHINHIDGIKSNNCVNNLEWVTQSENEIHAHKTGLKPKPQYWKGKFGINNYSSIKVQQMNKLYVVIDTHDSIREASIKCNVNESDIVKVCKGKRNTAGGYIWRYML